MPLGVLVGVLLAVSAAVPAVDDAAAYTKYQAAMQKLAEGETTPAGAEAEAGPPYMKYTFLENGRLTQEWVYPTGPREQTTLKFDVDGGELTAVTKASFGFDVSFIHDDSPVMSADDAAKRDRLKGIRLGMTAAEVRAIARPDMVLKHDVMKGITSQIARSPALRKPADGDWWVYRCGDLDVTVAVHADRVVEISEKLKPSARQLQERVKAARERRRR
jgi:hypothetical protein